METMFYIYNTVTYKLYHGGDYSPKKYKSYRGGKAQLTRLIKEGKLTKEWKVMSTTSFDNIEPVVTVHNMMSGQPVQIRTRDVGSCVDPSTERYWSM